MKDGQEDIKNDEIRIISPKRALRTDRDRPSLPLDDGDEDYRVVMQHRRVERQARPQEITDESPLQGCESSLPTYSRRESAIWPYNGFVDSEEVDSVISGTSMSSRPADTSRKSHSTPNSDTKQSSQNSPSRRVVLITCFAIIFAIGLIIYFILSSRVETEVYTYAPASPPINELVETVEATSQGPSAGTSSGVGYSSQPEVIPSVFVTAKDTVVNAYELKLLYPGNMTPSLSVGSNVLQDPDVKMAFAAADIREDNGEIVGTFVNNGELIGKGQSKSGYCAIIDSKMTIGVADATPYLEQALESDGYFFRQYPLVVANQPVEIKPKGTALRKALAEIGGETVVVLSKEKMTYEQFSRTLSQMGVSNAVTLVGGLGPGFAVTEDARLQYGSFPSGDISGLNFIVWR